MAKGLMMRVEAGKCGRGGCRVGLVVALALAPVASLAQSPPQPSLSAPGPAPGPTGNPPSTTAATGPQAMAVTGPVAQAFDTATLVIAGTRIPLWGIDPGPRGVFAPFDAWLRHSAGKLTCEPVAKTGRFKCMTADRHDVAEVALLSGFARVGQGAMNDYRSLEDQAREQHHGLWQQQ